MNTTSDVLTWLMAGDPAIRWQTLRDLSDAPEAEWQAERRRTLVSGWGAQFLERQDTEGTWGGGIYSPKWTSTTYTLETLIHIGIPNDCAAAQYGARLVMEQMLGETCDKYFINELKNLDRCIVGMLLQIGVYFELDDGRIEAIVDNLLHEIMPDGGWNCRKGRKMSRRSPPHHSSFHTTFNVLDGLREYVEKRNGALRSDLLAAEHDALELLLQHRLLYSDHTGQLIRPDFAKLVFPFRWHYSLLRALAYFARTGAPRDPRLQDAVDLMKSQRGVDSSWPLQHRYTGQDFFHMERVGSASRWVILNALRILKWWEM